MLLVLGPNGRWTQTGTRTRRQPTGDQGGQPLDESTSRRRDNTRREASYSNCAALQRRWCIDTFRPPWASANHGQPRMKESIEQTPTTCLLSRNVGCCPIKRPYVKYSIRGWPGVAHRPVAIYPAPTLDKPERQRTPAATSVGHIDRTHETSARVLEPSRHNDGARRVLSG
jgi:hypothetical protein